MFSCRVTSIKAENIPIFVNFKSQKHLIWLGLQSSDVELFVNLNFLTLHLYCSL